MSKLIDIGHGVTIQFWIAIHKDGTKEIGGLIETHPDKRDISKRCEGSISFKGFAPENRPAWNVKSMEPLTLTPSILCTVCGHHGWIENGKWIPA